MAITFRSRCRRCMHGFLPLPLGAGAPNDYHSLPRVLRRSDRFIRMIFFVITALCFDEQSFFTLFALEFSRRSKLSSVFSIFLQQKRPFCSVTFVKAAWNR